MNIKINRTSIFLLGTLIIYTFYLQNRLKIVLAGTVAPAEIISTDDVNEGWSKHFSRHTCARFEHPLLGTLYTDNTDEDLHVGDKIKVLYLNKSPGMAYIYTFYNFWLFGLLMTIIPMVLWVSFSLGYVNPNKVISIKIP
ncbi:MAG: hypothetical protein M0D57_19865 [Sphingobacteriales bacterium JAD_PAG50586_3]|nr:MAG: hypothetical protein M0D57_19865 [Sphingobacteriales bacterium JAD_PAG50586_3]